MNNIGKSLFDIGYLDTLAAQKSWLHRLDPRAKLITTLAFILTVVSFNKYALSELAPFFIYPVVLMGISGLSARYLLKKILIMTPFALMVGIFNPLIDRQILYQFGSWGVSGGWVSFLSIQLRFILTVSAALILIASTGVTSVCGALTKFGVPEPFVTQLMFFYRYVFVLTDEAERTLRARSFRAPAGGAVNFKTFLSIIGGLLLRALDRAERIYRAMCCRGFEGHVRVLRFMRIGRNETMFIFGWVFLFIFLKTTNVSLNLGLWVHRF